MATPMHGRSMAEMLRAEGVKVREYPGWLTHNRNHKGAWGEVHGIILHHTVTGPKVDGVEICHDGFSTLPGPLCHGVISRDGTVHLISSGRANHAGSGDPAVLKAVTDESYDIRPPAPKKHDGSPGAADGNRAFYGFECENLGDGVDPWPEVQVEAMVRASAAWARYHGWSAKSVIGHKEWSDWKSDPKGPKTGPSVEMPDLRRRIQERLNHEPSWSRNGSKPQPKPPAPVTPPKGTPVSSNLTHLVRTESTQLLPGSPVRIYWTGEYTDEPNQHGTGNFSVLSNADYLANLHLFFSGLDPDEALQVRHIETNTAGTATPGPLVNVDGFTAGGSVTRVATLVGSMRNGDVLSFEVTNLGSGTVTLLGARLMMLSWPL